MVFDGSWNDRSYSLEYREELAEHFDASFIYLNEVHLPGDHRDGQDVQI
jgi:hypothetical protein